MSLRWWSSSRPTRHAWCRARHTTSRPATAHTTRRDRMQAELVTNIRDRADDGRRDLLLNALTISSGAVDAISFFVLGKVFTAFMTGNIAFLGLRVGGASNQPGAVAVLVSMAGFALGAYLSTIIVKPSTGSSVWPQRVTRALGISLIAHAVFLAVWFGSNGQPSANVTHVLLGVWGLA